jgi:hypothetical protein
MVLCALVFTVNLSDGLQDNEPGRSIGKVSINGDLSVLELDDGALGKANPFDLTGHTLRFSP